MGVILGCGILIALAVGCYKLFGLLWGLITFASICGAGCLIIDHQEKKKAEAERQRIMPLTEICLDSRDVILNSTAPYREYTKQYNLASQKADELNLPSVPENYRLYMAVAYIENIVDSNKLPAKSWSDMIKGYSDIKFDSDEYMFLCLRYSHAKTTKTVRRHRGTSHGMSVRLNRAVSVRGSRYSGESESHEVERNLKGGVVYVSSKNFYYQEDGVTRKIPLSKILKVSATSDDNSLYIEKEAANSRPLEFYFSTSVTVSPVVRDILLTSWK